MAFWGTICVDIKFIGCCLIAPRIAAVVLFSIIIMSHFIKASFLSRDVSSEPVLGKIGTYVLSLTLPDYYETEFIW